MRLDRFLCKSTDLLRPEATALIHQGNVQVNGGVVINEAIQVHENNNITLNGVRLTPRPSRYIMLNKPLNTICSNVDEGYPSVFRYVEVERALDLHIAGRLDTDTTGLVLLTDDGRWSYNIITPKKACKKQYRVGLRDPIRDDVALRFEQGIQLQGEKSITRPAKLETINSKEVLLTITEGRFHQVKRMFAAVGNRVVSLHRQKVGEITLDIDVGQWRYLTEKEIMYFK
ncbi:pseudouridine synthase [Alkalimarinus coralli]|uniref:pseudouridine synthase n=1 Tax=Alkalimarinus coralli TaxID=2935863 RepID=UPI00202B8D35|nr:pseudouridine synthase [Alkalimarinus coralli]